MVGMSRTIDPLGRVVIPAEIRRSLSLSSGSVLAINISGNRIILTRPTTPARHCAFCQGEADLASHRNTFVCERCLDELTNK